MDTTSLIKINKDIEDAALIIWNFCCIDRHKELCSDSNPYGCLPLGRAECLLLFGCQDIGVPRFASDLIQMEIAPLAVVSGNTGQITEGVITTTESRIFMHELRRLHAEAKAKLLEEPEAKHTKENIILSRLLLARHGIQLISSCIAITKPYSTRRVLATVQKQWGALDWQVASENISLDLYCFDEFYRELTYHFLVGEIERIFNYGGKDILEQAIPDTVWAAYYHLRLAGFGIDRSEIKNKKNLLSKTAIDRLLANFDDAVRVDTPANPTLLQI